MFGQLVSFSNLVPPFPIGIDAIFFFMPSHYIVMLRSQSSSFTSGCNCWRQPCCITSCTVGGSTRNDPICSCEEMAALRMTRTPKNIGKILGTICFYFCVNNKLVLIFSLLIYRVVVPIMWTATFSNGDVDKNMSSSWHKWGKLMILKSNLFCTIVKWRNELVWLCWY